MPNSKPAPLISILSRTKTYNLGRMPNEEVAISLFLFAHDDAGYDWNWGEYRAWLDGFATNVTYLSSSYIFLEPKLIAPTPTPTERIFSGMIIDAIPATIQTGQPLNIYVSFSAHTTSGWEVSNGWYTQLEAGLNGMSGKDDQLYYGY